MVAKKCPGCGTEVPIARKNCNCGYRFIRKSNPQSNEAITNILYLKSKKMRSGKCINNHVFKQQRKLLTIRVPKQSVTNNNVEIKIKRPRGRPRKRKREDKLLNNHSIMNNPVQTLELQSPRSSDDHNNASTFVGDATKRKRGRPKGSKNKPKIVYSRAAVEEQKKSSQGLDDMPFRLNIPEEKNRFILEELNRKFKSQTFIVE